MEKDYTIALLIDCDNLSADYYEIILNELSEIGNIRYKRAYADFSDLKNKSWSELCMKRGIVPIHTFTPVKNKNTSDMLIAIDAMDLFYTGDIDAFCLATSDSDFCRLGQRLIEGGMHIIIAGKEQSHISLNNSCDKFLMLDKLKESLQANNKIDKNKEGNSQKTKKSNAKSATASAQKSKADESSTNKEEKVSAPSLSVLKEKIADYIGKTKHYDNGWANYNEVVILLEKEYPQFNHKIYNAKNKQAFFKELIGCSMKTEGTTCKISMSKQDK